MVKRTGPQTLELQNLIRDLKILGNKEDVSLWKRVADDLEKPTRIRREVNLYKIDKNVRDGEIALVPGKVLSIGILSKKLTIAAYSFSDNALEKIKESGAKAISIDKLMKENPKGKKVRIIG
jgi:large subunit ribosomal protein L18e